MTKLWRYMNLSHFLWMLNEQALYFANLAEFDDDWEGALTSMLVERFEKRGATRAEELGLPEKREGVGIWYHHVAAKQAREIGEAYRYLCWHENKSESVAMWKLYTRGQDGVAIQTTLARIESCLSELPYAGVGRVDYTGHESQGEGTSPGSTRLALLKRQGFAHEQEVRLFMHNYDRPELAEYWWEESSGNEDGPKGGLVKVDIAHLIERIVTAPEYPAWSISSLQSTVSAAGLTVKVEASSLLNRPAR